MEGDLACVLTGVVEAAWDRARGAADRSPLSVTRRKPIILFLTRHSDLMKVHILGRHGKTKVETTSGSASSKDTAFVRTLMRASFRVHVQIMFRAVKF